MTALNFVPGGEWEILWNGAVVLRKSGLQSKTGGDDSDLV